MQNPRTGHYHGIKVQTFHCIPRLLCVVIIFYAPCQQGHYAQLTAAQLLSYVKVQKVVAITFTSDAIPMPPRPLETNYIVLFMGIFAINNILYVPRMPQPECHIQMARRTALNYMCAAVRCGVQRLLRNVIMQLNASPFQCSTFHLHMKDLSRRAGPKNKKCQWIEMAFGGNYEMDGMEGRWRWRKAENYCNKEPIKGLTMSGARHREEKFFNYKFKFKKHLSCQRLYHRERAVCECE